MGRRGWRSRWTKGIVAAQRKKKNREWIRMNIWIKNLSNSARYNTPFLKELYQNCSWLNFDRLREKRLKCQKINYQLPVNLIGLITLAGVFYENFGAGSQTKRKLQGSEFRSSKSILLRDIGKKQCTEGFTYTTQPWFQIVGLKDIWSISKMDWTAFSNTEPLYLAVCQNPLPALGNEWHLCWFYNESEIMSFYLQNLVQFVFRDAEESSKLYF